MFESLGALKDKYNDLEVKISDPDVIANQEQWQKLMKEHADLSPVVKKYDEYVKAIDDINGAKEIIANETDEDLRSLAKEELSDLEKNLEVIIDELKILLLPKDPNDDKNVIVEIRGGAGGYKEVVFMITGKGAYSRLKFESGVHRVQRVPETESQGRIHTSTVTVAVLPEAEDVEVNLDVNDVRVDVFRSSGNGGQSVNTTDSAVRLTHIPTGIVISMQDEKSQLKNKEKAFKILKAKLYDMELEKAQKEMASQRKSQVGTGDRAERIRTYNYPQGRVSDHRIGLNLYKLETFLNGDMDEVIDALITTDQADKLNSLEEE